MSILIDKTMAFVATHYPELMERLAHAPSCNCTNRLDDEQLCRRCQLIRFAELHVRIAELEAEVERLKAELATARQKHKEDATQIVDLMNERRGWTVTKLEDKVERLKAEHKRIANTALDDWKRCREARRDAEEYCVIITKLGRRLGCLKKRRKRELARFSVQIEQQKQLVRLAYANGRFDGSHSAQIADYKLEPKGLPRLEGKSCEEL